MSHAKYSPSAAHRWSVCPGSLAMEAVWPEEDRGENLPAKEGTTVHWGIEQVLVNGLWSGQEMIGRVCPETEMEITQDMVPNIDTMVNYVRARLAEMGLDTELHVEVKVDPGASFGTKDCTGTADAVLVNDTELEVIDYKNGSGVMVEVEDNEQLEIYTIGCINEFGKKQKYRSTIVQPRKEHPDGPIRSVDSTDDDITDWIGEYAEVIEEIENGSMRLNPDDKACRWCKAKAACPAIADHNLRQAQVYFSPVPVAEAPPGQVLEEVRENIQTRSVSSMPIETTVQILDIAPMLRGWLEKVEAYAIALLHGGHDLPGYKLVAGRSNRRWDSDLGEDKIRSRLRSFGLKKADMIDEKLRSPAKIESIVQTLDLTDRQKATFQKLIVKPEGKPTVAPAADPRQPLDPGSMFKKQEKQDTV